MTRCTIAVFLSLLVMAGCKKDDVKNELSAGTGKIELLKGNNQSGLFGELLKDTIVLKISSKNPEDHFIIKYSLLQGNGKIETGNFYSPVSLSLDTAGSLRLMWRMGCDYNIQKVSFYVYTDSLKWPNGYSKNYHGLPSDSITLTANAIKPNGWCRACGIGYVDQYYSRINTYDDSTLYLASYGLYSSTDGGLNWYKVDGVPNWSEIINVQFNSKGWCYVLTKRQGVYYSREMKNWTAINNGFLDMYEPTAFYVEDSALWVSFYSGSPYRSTNNGEFWRRLIVGGGSQRFYFINRHPNGTIFLFDDWDNMKMSRNNGDNWESIFGYYFDIHDFKIDSKGTFYIGSDDATLTIIDSAGTSVHRYYQWNASSQSVSNIVISSNDVFYLVNDTPAPGIYSKNSNWNKIDIGFNDRITYFFLKQNKAFLLFSQGWLYYHH